MIYKNKTGIRATVPFHGAKIIHPKIIKQIFLDLKLDN
jgi:predicted RNA binding protein YcfA (HicA-like mRNA interferase family)